MKNKSVNVYAAGVNAIHLQKRADRGADPGEMSFCGKNCTGLHLVSLPVLELHLSCPDCDKQVQMLRSIK